MINIEDKELKPCPFCGYDKLKLDQRREAQISHILSDAIDVMPEVDLAEQVFIVMKNRIK